MPMIAKAMPDLLRSPVEARLRPQAEAGLDSGEGAAGEERHAHQVGGIGVMTSALPNTSQRLG